MLNYETLLSSYDDKLTLLQWLKKVEAALKDASAVSFKVNKKGNATLTFSIVFEDGSEIESGEIVLQQGESVASAAVVNGHLVLTLTNGDELDAGQLLNGDLNVSGNLAATGKITGGEIVEDMTGYSFAKQTATKGKLEYVFAGAVKNGNKLTLVNAFYFTKNAGETGPITTGRFYIPVDIMAKIFPAVATYSVSSSIVPATANAYSIKELVGNFVKYDIQSLYSTIAEISSLNDDVQYYIRQEITILLSDNLAA